MKERRRTPAYWDILKAKDIALGQGSPPNPDEVSDALTILSDALTLAELELQKARTDSDYWRQFNEAGTQTEDASSTSQTNVHKETLDQISYMLRTYFLYDVTAVFPQKIDEAIDHIEQLYEGGKVLAAIIRSKELDLTEEHRSALELFD